MKKSSCLLFLAGLAGSVQAGAHGEPSNLSAIASSPGKPDVSSETACRNDDPETVVVCGRSQQRFRIDPTILEASREAAALPPKQKLDATATDACIGPNCGGGTIPLVGMALTAAKAAVLASEGEDWREAFRTHPDQYQVYQGVKARKSHISIGVTAGNIRQ